MIPRIFGYPCPWSRPHGDSYWKPWLYWRIAELISPRWFRGYRVTKEDTDA